MNAFVRRSKEPERILANQTTEIVPPPGDTSAIYNKYRSAIPEARATNVAFELRRVLWSPAYESWFHRWCVKSRLRTLLEMVALR